MKARGWTLLELVVVIAIILILIGIFVPAIYHMVHVILSWKSTLG